MRIYEGVFIIYEKWCEFSWWEDNKRMTTIDWREELNIAPLGGLVQTTNWSRFAEFHLMGKGKAI